MKTPTVLNQSILSRDYTNEVAEKSVATLTDRQLLRLVADGDEQALDKLYQRHSTTLYNYLLRLIHEPPIAEELLQEVFLAVWQGAGRFRGQSKITTWLFRIAHNQAVSWLRRRREATTLDELTHLPAEGNPEEKAMASWRADQIQWALDQLSPKHRAVLELAFYHGLPYAEIAEIVDCPVGTVKSRVSYARKYLNDSLSKLGFENHLE
jgi:RNA polymerase sigma-70 factor (ECF subfamily)